MKGGERMQKQTQEYMRVRNVIQADKSIMSDACKALVLHDFANKFDEYFDLIGLPKMQILARRMQLRCLKPVAECLARGLVF